MGLPEEVVSIAYTFSWKFIREKIQELPLKEDLTEEEFKALRTNFNLPSLGKLYVTHDGFKRIKDKYKHFQKIKEYEQNS